MLLRETCRGESVQLHVNDRAALTGAALTGAALTGAAGPRSCRSPPCPLPGPTGPQEPGKPESRKAGKPESRNHLRGSLPRLSEMPPRCTHGNDPFPEPLPPSSGVRAKQAGDPGARAARAQARGFRGSGDPTNVHAVTTRALQTVTRCEFDTQKAAPDPRNALQRTRRHQSADNADHHRHPHPRAHPDTAGHRVETLTPSSTTGCIVCCTDTPKAVAPAVRPLLGSPSSLHFTREEGT